MTDNTGGPAFPRPAGDYNGTKNGNVSQTGMTLRDYFAAKALCGLCADSSVIATCDKIATAAYNMADAMLAERGKA